MKKIAVGSRNMYYTYKIISNKKEKGCGLSDYLVIDLSNLSDPTTLFGWQWASDADSKCLIPGSDKSCEICGSSVF